MRHVEPSTQALADDGDLIEYAGFVFYFPSGTHAFWTGPGTKLVNGITYQSGGSLIEVSSGREVEGMESVPRTLTLRAIPNTDLTPDRLASIELEDYHRRPVDIVRLYANPATPNTIDSVRREYAGRIDRMDHVEDNEDYVLRCNLESRNRDNSKHGDGIRSDENQRLFNPLDSFLQHVAVEGPDGIWGRASE